MLALITLAGGELVCLDFGQPVEPWLTTEAQVRSILTGFEVRKAELIDIGFDEAVPVLVHILEQGGDDPSDILPPIKALGFLGRPQGASIAGAHIGHRDAAVRIAVIRSLGQMGKFESIPLIKPFLDSAIRGERREAIIALGKFAKPELLPEIQRAAGQDPELRKLAGEAKKRIDATVTGIETGRFGPFVEALIDSGEYEDILPLLMMCWRPLKQIAADRTRSPETRLRAVRVLSLGAARRASREMTSILADAQEPLALRLEAVDGLGRTRTRSALPQLIALLDSNEPGMRDRSIQALGRIGDARVLSPLLSKWNDGGPALRPRLRLAISRLCSRSGLSALLEPLRSYQPRSADAIYFISDSLELVSGYRRDLIDPELMSPLAEARRDALLLLASFGTKDDSEALENFRDTDSDPGNSEIANLGVERLKDIPLWERP